MAKGANVASAVVTVIPTMEGARAAIAGSLTPAASVAGDKAGEVAGRNFGNKTSAIAAKVLASAAAVATIGAALGKTVHKALDNYASYEQLVGGVETLFKDSADLVEKYAERAYKTAGLSANAYMETVTSFSASLLQGLGGNTKKAAEYADMAVTDMSDNANKMGTAMQDIQNAYQGFAKQNYTMLDNLKLGYGGTASEMARLINDSGVLGKKVKITAKEVNSVSFDKMIQAIHKVQEKLDITGTTSLEAAETIEGSINSMKAAWENWLTALGRDDVDMGKETQKLIDSIITVAKNVIPRIGVILGQIKNTFIESLPTIVKDLASSFADNFGINLDDALKKIDLEGIFKNNILPFAKPFIESFKGIGDAVVDVAKQYSGSFDPLIGKDGAFQKLIDKSKEVGKEMLGIVSDKLLDFFYNLQDAIRTFGDTMKPVFDSFIDNIGKFIENAIPILEDIWESFKSIIDSVTEIIDNLKGMGNGQLDVMANALQAILPVVQMIATWLLVQIQVITKIFEVVMKLLEPLTQILGTVLGPILEGIGWVLEQIGIGLQWWIDNMIGGFEELTDNIDEALDFIASIPDNIIKFFSDLPNKMTRLIDNLLQDGKKKIEDTVRFLSTVPGKVIDFFKELPGKFHSKFTQVKEGVKTVFDNIVNFIREIPGKIVDFFKSIPEQISNIFKNIHIPTFHVDGKFNLDPANFELPSIRFFAHGGIVDKPTLSVIGEGREREAVLTQSQLHDFAGSIEARGNGGDTNVYIDGAKVNDDEQINELLLAAITRIFRKAGMNRA